MGDPVELFVESCAAARKTYSGIKPLFASDAAIAAAGRHFARESLAPGKLVVGPATEDADLRFLARGSAIVTVQVGEGKPESVRTLEAPVSIGASAFALGAARGAAVVAWKPCEVLRLSADAFERIGQDAPAIAVGLLHQAAMDQVDWLRETRAGADAWSKRHAVRGHTERSFEPAPVAREIIPVDPDVQAGAVEALRKIDFLGGVSLLPFVDALGMHVHLALAPAGGAVVSHDERGGSLFLLLEGSARVTGRSGRVLGTFRAGGGPEEALIGEVAFLTQLGRDGTVTADTDCVLLEIPRAAVPWMVTKHPELAVRLHLALLRTLCWRLLEADAERARLAGRLVRR